MNVTSQWLCGSDYIIKGQPALIKIKTPPEVLPPGEGMRSGQRRVTAWAILRCSESRASAMIICSPWMRFAPGFKQRLPFGQASFGFYLRKLSLWKLKQFMCLVIPIVSIYWIKKALIFCKVRCVILLSRSQARAIWSVSKGMPHLTEKNAAARAWASSTVRSSGPGLNSTSLFANAPAVRQSSRSVINKTSVFL